MRRPDINEALRCLGAVRSGPELRRQAEQLADELSAALQPRSVWAVWPLARTGDRFRLEGTGVTLSGSTAARMLDGCETAALLACTLGARFDAMLRSAQARDMAKAVLLDALGSSFVEAGCDGAEEEISARFPALHRTDRFSPGYGDLPLDLQPALCAALDAQRRLGLTVTDSLLLNPVKSVTAVIGLSPTPQPARIRAAGTVISGKTANSARREPPVDADFFKQGIVLLDGAMGTVLQQRGLPPGGKPELLNFTDPELLRSIYREYIAAGSQILCANTFGASTPKLAGTGRTVDEVVSAAVAIAREAAAGTDVKVSLDVGPLGELLEPMGSLTFERAYGYFQEIALAGERAGADLVSIETMTDLYEAKAALLAVKENTRLPVFVTMSFEADGRTFTGCTLSSMARTLEGLGADAIGLNCSLGPDKLAPFLAELCACTRLPVIAKPNAGLPDPVTGRYGMGPEEFAAALLPCLEAGVTIFGGCCGTSPDYIRRLRAALDGKAPAPRRCRRESFLCTPPCPVPLDGVRIIGERVNPTGKKRFQQALLEDDLDYILDVAVQQEEAGADILDVNVGFPGVDEASMLPRVVKKLQSVVSLPLQLDSSSPEALEAGLRVYNGKAAVNSVNGDPESLARILPIVKKYGAAVVGLTLDQNGIPQTAEGRVAIARRILDAALARGIPAEDVWIDCLTLTVSAQQEQAAETLKAVRAVTEELGLRTVLGVSNISFGLPSRGLITRSFLTQALAAGLTLPILNPNQREMLDAVAAFRALSGEDAHCRAYVERFAGADTAPAPVQPGQDMTLEDAILRGLKGDAGRLARQALEAEDGLSLVEGRLIPALDRVGEGYETGRLFLPQLLSAAQAAQAVFEVVRAHLADRGDAPVKKGRIAVATVRGDIHDIGKNIVKTVLENYGYDVADLGRDVPPEDIVEAVAAKRIPLVGLSALMTTTLPAMEETTRLLKALPNPPVVWVGGAVVTPEYARSIGADYYARDAKQSVEIAKKVLG